MPADRHLGQAFGRYRIEALIGRGGMGVVYRARDSHLDRVVALKVLSDDRASDGAFRERFLRESRLLASIDHPNIVPVFDAGEHDGELFIAMRFIAGPELRAIIEADAPLDPGRAIAIVAQVADALDAAHAAGLVHRDVKPGNVLVVPGASRGDAGHAYLTDFGLTKAAASDTGLTQAGQFVGTPGYVAPEQIEGRAVDHRADVYALGCILYSCLTGVVPYPRDSTIASLWAHLQEPPPKPSERLEGIPAALDVVIATALAKSPADRYQTCGALAWAAREAVRGGTGRAARGLAAAATIVELPATPVSAEPPPGAVPAAPPAVDLPAAADPTPPPLPVPAGATILDLPVAAEPAAHGERPPTVIDAPVARPPAAPPSSSPPDAAPESAAPDPAVPVRRRRRPPGLTAPLAAVIVIALVAVGALGAIGLTGGRGPGPSASGTGVPEPGAGDVATHVVEPGETLDSIAARVHLSVAELLALNPGVTAEDVIAGFALLIPVVTAGQPTASAGPTATPSPPSGSPAVAGETASPSPIQPASAAPPTPGPTPTKAPIVTAGPTRAPTPPTAAPTPVKTPTPTPVKTPTPTPVPTPTPQPNADPVAATDTFYTNEYPGDPNWYIFVLDNDHDPDGDAIRIYERSQTTEGGNVVITTHAQRPGQTVVRYYAPACYSGWDYFYYWITDDRGGTAGGTVNVWVVQPPC